MILKIAMDSFICLYNEFCHVYPSFPSLLLPPPLLGCFFSPSPHAAFMAYFCVWPIELSFLPKQK